MRPLRSIAIAVALPLLGASCGGDASRDEAGPGAAVFTSTVAPETSSPPPGPSAAAPSPSQGGSDRTSAPVPVSPSGDRELSPLADLVQTVGDIRFDPDAPLPEAGPAPIGLSIPEIGIDKASVRDVGVEANGEMEIPGGSEIGWYRWSPSPGHEGSAVLAAHIAWNGRDGVFRDLDDLEIGARFTVHYADGSEREFEVTERAQYGKRDLPFERVFARDGEPTVVLISCGGDFNRTLSSYEDNVVAYAAPV